MDLIKRFSNKNAFLITERLLERNDREKLNLGVSKLDSDLYSVAKIIYKALLLQLNNLDNTKQQELSYFIDNIESNEQFIVDYLKSTLWSYNKKAEIEIDKFWEKSNSIMSRIG